MGSLIILIITLIYYTDGQQTNNTGRCQFPSHFLGDWYSIDQGVELHTLINPMQMTNEIIADSECFGIKVFNDTIDADGYYDGQILVHNKVTNCYQCFEMYHRTVNIIQYKQSTCVSPTGNRAPKFDDICQAIVPQSDLLTMFRVTLQTVNCKTTWEGTFGFSYEVDEGGGGICNSTMNAIVACQQPGSPYVDNQVFTMNFGKCKEVTSSLNQQIRFQCMGSWTDGEGNIYSGLTDIGKEVYRERFRCMMTRQDQQYADNTRFYSLTRWAECSSLKSPYDGPIRLKMMPAYIGSLGVKVYGTDLVTPSCNFPRNFTGTWFTTAEFDSDVVINATHIYFKTKLDQYTYRESLFSCQQNRDSRYLVTAVTIGRCEVDYICFDFMPRHHNIIRWRMGRPSRLSSTDQLVPNFLERKFRQACMWTSFTLNRDDTDWRYSTFILNPPAPVPCPIGGRYKFTQIGKDEDKYVTRIRGITERPRHLIDCKGYTSEFKSCDDNPKKIYVDAEYCPTLDHTGKPIGEYDIADRELNCVGYWLEDMRSYMITYDMEDAVSAFRCWVYERLDWRDMVASRAIRAACGRNQTAFSTTSAQGASLQLILTESERLFDMCPQRYDTGVNPYEKELKIYVMAGAERLSWTAQIVVFIFAIMWL